MSAARREPFALPFLLTGIAWAWLCAGLVLLAAWAGRPEQALFSLLFGWVTLGPLLWLAGSAERPLEEAALLAALGLPPLVIAAAYAEDGARLAGAGYGAVGLLTLTWVAWGAPRRLRVALVGAFGLALPLGIWAWADLGPSRASALAPLAPALELREQLAGEPARAGFGALGGALLLALATRLPRFVPKRRLAAAAALALLGAGLAFLSPESEAGERALLGGHLRPGEPAPLELRPAPPEPHAARSFGHRYLARPGGGTLRVVPVPLASHLELEQEREGIWSRAPGTLGRNVLRGRDVLVGCLGATAWREGAALAPEGSKRVRLAPEQARLLAEGGSAFDVVLVSAAEVTRLAGPLRAWVAAGGVLGVEDASGLPALGAVREVGGRAEVRLGAGAAIAPLGTQGWAGLGRLLELDWEARHERRARRRAVAEVLLLDPDPEPRGLGPVRASLIALTLLWCVLGAFARRLEAPWVLAGAWAIALGSLALLRGQLPESPAWAASRRVLEVPSGETCASRLEVTTVLRARPEPVRVEWRDFAPPLPLFLSEGEAIEKNARLEPASGEASPAVVLPAEAGTRSFLRLDACALPGPIELSRTGETLRIRNGVGAPLERVVVVSAGGIRPLATIPAGGEAQLSIAEEEAGESLTSWRTQAADAEEARWRRRVATLLRGREGIALCAELPPEPVLQGGVEHEQARPRLVVVTLP